MSNDVEHYGLHSLSVSLSLSLSRAHALSASLSMCQDANMRQDTLSSEYRQYDMLRSALSLRLNG